jgi:hypothetical protein
MLVSGMEPCLSAAQDNEQSSGRFRVRLSRLISVGATEVFCALRTVGLMVTGRLAMPRRQVGRRLTFADGSSSTVYRETVRNGQGVTSPIILVVRFRLRLIGTSRFWHAAFRFESLFNTLLFAGHEGFVTKLWLTDSDTGYYRGIYEWDGEQSARWYAEVLRVVLQPWVQEGTFGYEILGGVNRPDFLAGRVTGSEVSEPGRQWCVPVSSERSGVG